jgi:hypothetical protein
MKSTTLRDVLFEDVDNGVARLAGLMEEQGKANGTLEAAAGKVVPAKQIGELLWDCLDLPLGGLVFGAWERHELVAKARGRTSAAAGTTERVRLAGHTVRSRHQPRFEIEIAGATFPVLEFEVSTSLVLDAAVVSIGSGRVTGVAPGACSATASLSCGGRKLCERSVKQVVLPDVIRPPADDVPA